MSKYYACLFCNYDELKETLCKIDNSYDAQVIAQSLEARSCPSYWIQEAYNKYFELLGE